MKTTDTSRRDFIKQNSIAGLGALLLSVTGSYATAQNNSAPRQEPFADHEKSTERTLEQLRDLYKAALFNRFIPNMESIVIDKQYGGFMCDVDIANRKLLSTNKSAWFEGRGIWTYSFLYNNFGKDPRFLEVASKSKDFILKHQPKDNSFWFTSYTREGVPTGGPGDIYCNLFIAEGLAELSKATGDKQYREQARKIIFSALARYDSPDYKYPITYGPASAPEIPAPRVVGHWMVFLRAATQFVEQGKDPEMEQLATRCVDAILNHHLNPDYKLLNEGLNHNMTLPENEWAQFSYLGHGIETLWMVMAEAVRSKDKAIFTRAGEAFKRHVTVATDAVEGGFFRALDHVENYTFKTDKVLWLQEEVLNGALILMEHTGDAWAKEQFYKTYAYIEAKHTHPEYAFAVESGDRSMKNYKKVRAEHYHHPRHLMLNLLALERMIARRGKLSGVFV